MPMTKTQVVAYLAEEVGVTKKARGCGSRRTGSPGRQNH